jgi:hypothetical protein
MDIQMPLLLLQTDDIHLKTVHPVYTYLEAAGRHLFFFFFVVYKFFVAKIIISSQFALKLRLQCCFVNAKAFSELFFCLGCVAVRPQKSLATTAVWHQLFVISVVFYVAFTNVYPTSSVIFNFFCLLNYFCFFSNLEDFKCMLLVLMFNRIHVQYLTD